MDIPSIPNVNLPVPENIFQEIMAPRWSVRLYENMYFSPGYLQAGTIVILLFIFTLSMARLRRMYVKWSFKGAPGMIAMGFLLAIILEAFLIIGGRTIFTEFLGWNNPPKPISVALDSGKERLVDVLGDESQVPMSQASDSMSSEMFIRGYEELSEDEAETVREYICTQ